MNINEDEYDSDWLHIACLQTAFIRVSRFMTSSYMSTLYLIIAFIAVTLDSLYDIGCHRIVKNLFIIKA